MKWSNHINYKLISESKAILHNSSEFLSSNTHKTLIFVFILLKILMYPAITDFYLMVDGTWKLIMKTNGPNPILLQIIMKIIRPITILLQLIMRIIRPITILIKLIMKTFRLNPILQRLQQFQRLRFQAISIFRK